MEIVTNNKKIAYFISPHGFGHASRASAVMSALLKIDPDLRFDIFTTVPEWFFRNSIKGEFGYHSLHTDIGLLQQTPLKADIPGTIRLLDDFLPFDSEETQRIANVSKVKGCDLVICDIAPMGIEVADKTGIPSVLIENFTWDWIYRQYQQSHPGIIPHIKYLEDIFKKATYHIQTAPICKPEPNDLYTSPISREVRDNPHVIRKKLGIKPQEKIVMITMGGVKEELRFIERLEALEDVCFIIPGINSAKLERHKNIILLPYQSDLFHPDLVNACDVVIGKVGYSTLAEVFHAGVPFGYIVRKDFRESKILVDFIKDHMPGLPIGEVPFYNGDWLTSLSRLIEMPRKGRKNPNGAGQVAEFVHGLI